MRRERNIEYTIVMRKRDINVCNLFRGIEMIELINLFIKIYQMNA